MDDKDKNLLKQIWGNAKDFEEILNFGLENNFISSSDIIHASDIYRDPDKEYDDEEIKEMIKSSNIADILRFLQEEYSLKEIVDNLDSYDIMRYINNYEILDYLDGTWELDNHDDDVRSNYYNEYIDEWIKEFEAEYKERIENISNWSPDELHRFICDIVGCNRYDKTVIDKLLQKLKNNTYVKYENR